MGREIRRVPPHWEHPCYDAEEARYGKTEGAYRPCHDEDFATAAAKWKAEFAKWEAGTHPNYDAEYEFWEGWYHPPEREECRPAFDAEPTWFQVYETVSEGTPVSPPFATEGELIEYLVAHGDYWCQKRGDHPPSRDAASSFVRGGWAPSAIINRDSDGTSIRMGIDACEDPDAR